MKHLTSFSVILLMVLALGSSCQKQEQEPNTPLVFKSLTASSPSFVHGENVQLTAEATGTNITYYWTFVQGSVSGSGSNVVYSCDYPGSQTVVCTVKDGAGNIKDKHLVLNVQ